MALVSLRKEFSVAIGAGEAAIRIDTDEIDDAISTLLDVAKKYDWELRVWDRIGGLKVLFGGTGKSQHQKAKKGGPENLQGPATALGELLGFLDESPKIDSANKGEVVPVILVIKNGHLAWDRAREDMSSAVQHLVGDKIGDRKMWADAQFRQLIEQAGVSPEGDTGKFLVTLMPAEAKLPAEVRPLFKHIVHELPDEEELLLILNGVIQVDDDEEMEPLLSPEVRAKVCKFALGLTRLQAEGVFSACMVQFGKQPDFSKLLPKYVWEQKSKALNEEGLVTLYQGTETFKEVVGLTGVKDVMARLLKPDEFSPEDPDIRAKGLLLVGAPGGGKTLIAKASGGQFEIPTLMVDIGSWFGGIVGDTERNTRKGFQVIRAHAPCIAVIDECEKVMPSARSGDHDSGVGRRMAGSFMTMLNDMKEPVFWVFTANDVENMHEAFFRAERVDAVFYVRLPSEVQRAAAWELYLAKFFPEEIGGKTFPRALTFDATDILDAYKRSKKIPDPVEWGHKLAAAIMTKSPDMRTSILSRISKTDDDLFTATKASLVLDEQWTFAEIRACCRLSRRLNEPLVKTSKRIRPVAISAEKSLRRLEKWATQAALDAETGELYAGDESSEDKPDAPQRTGNKVRRSVRSVRE